MKRKFIYAIIILLTLGGLSGCLKDKQTESSKTSAAVERQQGQFAKAQPIPVYDWSLERDLLIQLYNIRNMKAITHSVWRSDYGTIEGDCASIGFGIPYDTSLTNPLVATDTSQSGDVDRYRGRALASIEQPEPNGVYASKNTSATWVMCVGDNGTIEPVYIESKVTVYPYHVKVNYSANRVIKAGNASVTIKQ